MAYLSCASDVPLRKSNICQLILVLSLIAWSLIYIGYFNWVDSSQTNNKENHRRHATEKKLCAPKTKIGFLKTHGTGSSVVQQIFLRYGYNKGLSFVFGKNGSIDTLTPLSVPFTLEYFNDANTSDLPWHKMLIEEEGYDVSALYMKWNKTAISRLLGPDYMFFTGNDAFYFTIVGNPSTVFETLYESYNLSSSKTLNMDIHQYIKGLPSYILQKNYNRVKHYLPQMGLNQQILDMGLMKDNLDKTLELNFFIKSLEQEFDFVMIDEFFYESLVLLADRLCFPLEYMVGLEHTHPKSKLNEKERRRLSVLQRSDELIYNLFSHKLHALIENYGVGRMSEDVRKLKRLNEVVDQVCSSRKNTNHTVHTQKVKVETTLIPEWSNRNIHEQCSLLNMKEDELIRFVYQKQKEKFLLMQQKRSRSNFIKDIELSFGRYFLWG